LAALFIFGKAIIRKGLQWLNQKLQMRSRPTDSRAVLEAVTDLLRPKSKLMLENTLHQEVAVLRRHVKRPKMPFGASFSTGLVEFIP
jgi:hypothetical protein